MTGEHPHAGERRSEAAGASCPVVPSHKLPGDIIAALSVCVMTPETCPPRAHGHRRRSSAAAALAAAAAQSVQQRDFLRKRRTDQK